ncbi:GNAT superfamily N-acetyltransferase [Streptacidiphilus sp. MAP12-33]|uniref:GNAT family N-acetyltransferase n=1 Tax=Streptacidiphilus sp. MAP12-33 TaxID=3156266 RepID=UPI0035118AB1
MIDWKLRPATPDDLEPLVEIRAVAMRPDLERLGRYDPHRVRQRFRDAYDPALTWVIETAGSTPGAASGSTSGGTAAGETAAGSPAGCVALRPDGGVLWLEHFYLASALQGAGIGTAVLRELLGRCSAKGTRVRLNVLQGSPARRLYERFGFTLESQDPVDVYMVREPDHALA